MKILRQLRSLFRRQKLDAEMTEEMRAHVDLQMERNLAAGLKPDEARYLALRQFGNVVAVQEACRERRSGRWLGEFIRDFQFGVRGLVRSRGFAAVAVLTLALGIGATTSIFSVVYGVLLNPYPYAKSNKIWAPEVTSQKTGHWLELRITDYLGMAKLPGVASAMATSPGSVTLSGGTNPEIISGVRVTGTAFSFLGVAPVIGRGLALSDFEPGGEARAVTVISYKLWQRLFNGSANAVGKSVVIDDVPHVVVGVMPPRFGWFTNDGLWLPLPTTNLNRSVYPIVRLKPRISAEVAAQQLHTLLTEQARHEPEHYPHEGMNVRFNNYLNITVASGQMRMSLIFLLFAVGFLLLIVCTNVANLQLARGVGRSREIAVRLALGAGRLRIFRQLLTESVVLSLAGGALGVFFSTGMLELIVVLLPPNYVPNEARITLNVPVLAVSAVLAVLVGVVAGLVPGWQCTRADVNEALKDGTQAAGGSRRGNRTRNSLVVAQVALSVTLLVGASLSIHSFVKLQSADLGFNIKRLLFLEVPLNTKRYTTFDQRNGFFREFMARIRTLPGVSHVSVSEPPGLETGSSITVPGQPKPPGDAALNFIDTDYLATLGIQLKAGRNLTENEVASGQPVALISEAAAKWWENGEDPVGRIVEVDALLDPNNGNLVQANRTKAVTIVGVIADTFARGLQQPAPATLLVPYTLKALRKRALLIRTEVEPSTLVNAVRAELRTLDKEQPMSRPMTSDEIMHWETQQPRFNLALLTMLAVGALVFASAGIYSVLAYAVAQRSREIGLRMALGADRDAILRLFVLLGGKLLGIGTVIGLGASVALAQVVSAEVFNGPVLDPVAFGAAVLLLGVAALLASYLPAHRATKVDPMGALRTE
jgi:putative ABC transport system permease protein